MGAAAVAAAASAFFFGFGEAAVSRPEPIGTASGPFVALGDSYSAGEGLNPYLSGTQSRPVGNRCHRSTQAYGAILAGSRRDFLFKACSGAVIAEIHTVGQQHGGVDVGGPQLTGIADAGLVTITIGGNDAEFADVVQFCARRTDCIDSRRWNRDGHATLRSWVDDRVGRISGDLAAMYSEVNSVVGDARVLVLGYPRLFSVEHGSGGQRSCLVYGLFSADERAELRALGDLLNLEIARQAFVAGYEYIHVSDAFDDHETCGHKGQWLQFFNLDVENLTTKDVFDAGNFHPTADGQRMLARLVACYLKTHPEPDVPAELQTRAPAARNLAVLVGKRPVGRQGDAVLTCAREGG